MAHLVYKRNFQSQKSRDKYKSDLKNLHLAKNAGLLDNATYEAAKKNLDEAPELPPIPLDRRRNNSDPTQLSRPAIVRKQRSTSTSSGSSGPHSICDSKTPETSSELSPKSRIKKGRIIDRNDIGRLVYKRYAQTEEDRAALKAELRSRKDMDSLQLGDNYAHLDGHTISTNSESFQLENTARPSSTAPSSSSSQKSGQKGFRVFKKRSKTNTSPVLQPTRLPPILTQDTELRENRNGSLIAPLSPTNSKRNSDLLSGISVRERSESFVTVAPSTVSKGRTLSVHRNSRRVEEPRTLADFFLVGSSSNSHPVELPHHPHPRRHSCSSTDLPIVPNSRRQSTASRNGEQDEFVFPLSGKNPGDPHYGVHRRDLDSIMTEQTQVASCRTPAATVLLDLFLSMLDEFSNVTKMFSFAKHDEIVASCANSIVEKPEAELDEEMVLVKSIIEKRAWFLMSAKWLSFGRLLFSPGHHLLNLGGERVSSLLADEVRILDLDGATIGDWSWHCAKEYPDALVYNLDSSELNPAAAASIQPRNIRQVKVDTLTSLTALPSNSFDVISSRMLPAFTQKSEWLTILKECFRILKRDGYLELTIVDPVLNNMGPSTKQWIHDHILQNSPRTFDIRPSKRVLQHLGEAGFTDVKKCWVWMPTTSIGDELSTVTSKVGRYLYDELYRQNVEDTHTSGPGTAMDSEKIEWPYGLVPHKELEMWRDEEILAECNAENTSFSWLKCHARKS